MNVNPSLFFVNFLYSEMVTKIRKTKTLINTNSELSPQNFDHNYLDCAKFGSCQNVPDVNLLHLHMKLSHYSLKASIRDWLSFSHLEFQVWSFLVSIFHKTPINTWSSFMLRWKNGSTLMQPLHCKLTRASCAEYPGKKNSKDIKLYSDWDAHSLFSEVCRCPIKQTNKWMNQQTNP